ncbi:MAG: transcriptional repressor LexA [Pseudomonadota bacterium]
MDELTERQQQVLDCISRHLKLHGMPPTVAEIAAALELSSPNGVRGHLQALAKKGAIELIPNASRGIRIVQQESKRAARSRGLPIVGQVAAGSPILAEEHIEDYCRIDPEFFRPKADYLLRVRGESMRDIGILDDDLLAVKRQPDADNGQIVVARLHDEVTVKRLRKRGDKIYLQAENEHFPPIIVDLQKQSLSIEGIAVGVLRHW